MYSGLLVDLSSSILRDLPGLAILILGFVINQLGESTLVRRASSSHRRPSRCAFGCTRSKSVKSDAKEIKLEKRRLPPFYLIIKGFGPK